MLSKLGYQIMIRLPVIKFQFVRKTKRYPFFYINFFQLLLSYYMKDWRASRISIPLSNIPLRNKTTILTAATKWSQIFILPVYKTVYIENYTIKNSIFSDTKIRFLCKMYADVLGHPMPKRSQIGSIKGQIAQTSLHHPKEECLLKTDLW